MENVIKMTDDEYFSWVAKQERFLVNYTEQMDIEVIRRMSDKLREDEDNEKGNTITLNKQDIPCVNGCMLYVLIKMQLDRIATDRRRYKTVTAEGDSGGTDEGHSNK